MQGKPCPFTAACIAAAMCMIVCLRLKRFVLLLFMSSIVWLRLEANDTAHLGFPSVSDVIENASHMHWLSERGTCLSHKRQVLASMHAGAVMTKMNACCKNPLATLSRLLFCHCLSSDTEHASRG